MSNILRINHVAIVVEEIEPALEFWRDSLGLEVTHVEKIPSQKANVAFLPTGESDIELVKPTTDESGIARFLKKRGPGIHHICLEVDDLRALMTKLKERDVQLINQEPMIGAGGKRIAFIHPSSAFGVLVELNESSGRK